MSDTNLGLRIRRARERRRWSQQQLAAAFPPDPQGRRPSLRSIGRWERGEAVPRGAIGALEDILGVKLTGDEEDEIERVAADVAAARDLTDRQKRVLLDLIGGQRSDQQRRIAV